MKMTESLENYLETILILSKGKSHVRSIDVANELDFKKSSISVAMKNLRENGYIVFSPEGYITLTGKGDEVAKMIYERHETLSKMLSDMGVPSDIALADACKIEHVISAESFDAIKKYIKNNEG